MSALGGRTRRRRKVTALAPAIATAIVLPPSLEGAPADVVQARFMAMIEATWGKVREVVRRSRLDDVEGVEQQILFKAWRAYPRMFDQEWRAERRGLPSPHHWPNWLCRLAKRICIDEATRGGVARQLYGTRAVRRRGDRERVGGGAEGESVPMDPDELVAEHGDPAVEAERAELRSLLRSGLRELEAPDRALLRAWVLGVPDLELAPAMGLQVVALRRRRQRAMVRLRTVFRARGYGARQEVDGGLVADALGLVRRARERELGKAIALL